MPFRKADKIAVLRRTWLFEECSSRELDLIATIAKEVDLPAGTAFIREGDVGREFFAVVEGTVEVRRNGRKLPVKGGSEFFGEIALISSRPRNATVTAVTRVKALVSAESDFSALLRRAGHLQLKLLRTLADRGTLAWGGYV